MTTIQLGFKGTVLSRADVSHLLKQPGDVALIERGYPRWLVMKCPDGCGEEVPINLDSHAGPAWRLYRSSASELTLYPSVWRDSGCESHFIVWRNLILLLGASDDSDYSSLEEDKAFDNVRDSVLTWLPTGKMVHFADLADQLGELPWDVLRACRDLVKRRLAVEGEKRQRQHFKRR